MYSTYVELSLRKVAVYSMIHLEPHTSRRLQLRLLGFKASLAASMQGWRIWGCEGWAPSCPRTLEPTPKRPTRCLELFSTRHSTPHKAGRQTLPWVGAPHSNSMWLSGCISAQPHVWPPLPTSI